jgi:hypothetical protein
MAGFGANFRRRATDRTNSRLNVRQGCVITGIRGNVTPGDFTGRSQHERSSQSHWISGRETVDISPKQGDETAGDHRRRKQLARFAPGDTKRIKQFCARIAQENVGGMDPNLEPLGRFWFSSRYKHD